MKRFLLVPIAVLALAIPAVVSAAGLTFGYNTGSFDFTDASIDTGYIGFTMNGDQLVVQVSSAGSVSAIPAISLVVFGPTTNALGEDVYPTLGQLQNVTLLGANGNQGFDVVHTTASVRTVAADYVDALTSLGFKVSQLSTGSNNVLSYDFTMNGSAVHAVFHQDGSSVTAHLAIAPSPAA